MKSKNSIRKPYEVGPAAYVLPADDPRPGGQAELLRTLQRQGCEISRATESLTVKLEAKKKTGKTSVVPVAAPEAKKEEPEPPQTRTFPAGSYVVRMDQPYSRIADMLLDYQYWSPNDPQKNPFDDTGWTFGELGNVQVVRIADTSILKAPMEKVNSEIYAPGDLQGTGKLFAVNHNTDIALMMLRYRFRNAFFEVADEPFEVAGKKFNCGSFLIRGIDEAEMKHAASELGLKIWALSERPLVNAHTIKAPRIALLHTWLSTQDEGWWRLAPDQLKVPYDYISTQVVARGNNLTAKYDVILFPPVGRGNPQTIISGMPMWGNPLPWKTSLETPNIGKIDSTDDLRPGLGWIGLENLQNFVRRGGLLIGVEDTADFAVTFGLTPGVSITRPQRLRVVGSVLRSKVLDSASPIVYGYGDTLSIYCADGPIFNVSSISDGRGVQRRTPDTIERTTGRGTPHDVDMPQNRPPVEIPEEPTAEAWEVAPPTDEQMRNGIFVIPPQYRPRVILRYADNKELLVSGLLDGGNELAQHAAVIDIPVEKGHVVLFSNNPIWRGETQGSYFLVFNAILNFDFLNLGRKLAEK